MPRFKNILRHSDILQLLPPNDTCTGTDYFQVFRSKRSLNNEVSPDIMASVNFFSSEYHSVWPLTGQEDRLYNQLISQLQKRSRNAASHAFGQELLFLSFMETIYELAAIGRKHIADHYQFGRKEELVMKFRQLALEHHTTERNLSFYSDRLFVTSKYLSETTKELTGKTAGQIISELNALEAKYLLGSTSLTIAEIAYRLNFCDPAFFSKFFKRLCGISPKAYRLSLVADTPH